MQWESHNYNNFIISFAKYFCSINFIFTLDSLIKYKWILKIKKFLLIINIVYINKISVTYN